jgi:asparagine synthetase B (glutamine-hydrolysing)
MSDHKYLLRLIEEAVSDAIDGAEDTTGIVVSGGLDSSTVACMARRLGYEMPLFTGFYDVPGFSELHYAHLVPGGFHHAIEIRPEDFVEHFDACAAALRPPYQGMGAFGQFMVGKYIAEHSSVKRVLSGEGSDELFGGYARQSIVAHAGRPNGYEDYQLPDDYPRQHRAALNYDFERLGDLLAVDDQCMAVHGLFAIAPFTDQRIQAFAHGLSLNNRINKDFLRQTVRGLVPDRIIDRQDKMGFPVPLAQWARDHADVGAFIHDRIGFLPDPEKPWDRTWWYAMLEATNTAPVAA